MADGRATRIVLLVAALALVACQKTPTPSSSSAPTRAAVRSEVSASSSADGIVQPRYSQVVIESGKNLAYDQPAATIDPRLTEHSRAMAQRVYRTAADVYCAVGYGLANMTMIEGADGIVIIDPLESVESARAAMAAFRTLTDKPVKAVVYTHNHYDHVMGTEAVATREQVASGEVPIFGHELLLDALVHQLSVVGEAIGQRSLYTFGSLLPLGPDGLVNEGIGPRVVEGQPTFIPPTRSVGDSLDVEVAGLHLRLLHAPSETDDQIVVWWPDRKLLHSGDVIQGETYPNLYTIRGTTYRDPVQWYRTIDHLRDLAPDYLVPSHGRPVEGHTEIASLLTAYRDAIQFTHDQAVRFINKGYTPDELAEAMPALPPHLAAHPWVSEFYGTVKHSVRNFYMGYLGWFEGDPTFLDPLPRRERAARMVAAMGGRDTVLRTAREAHDRNDDRWAAELATYLIRVDSEDREARSLKAQALRRLGFQQMNTNWRNFYLTAALELDGGLAGKELDVERGIAILSRLPFVRVLENVVCRVDPEKSRDTHMTLAFRLTDTRQDYALELRRGVVQIHDHLPPQVDVALSGSEDALRGVLLGQSRFAISWLLRDVRVDGSLSDVARFFSYFERPSHALRSLAAR